VSLQVQPQFNAGELSPFLLGRTDLPAYGQGLMRGLNTLILPHGPVVRRPGTVLAGNARPTARSLIEFTFGVGDSYQVEVGDGYFRFWRADGSPVMFDPDTPYELATPWVGDIAQQLRWHQSANTMWLAHGTTPLRVLKRIAPFPEGFALETYAFRDGPWLPANPDSTWIVSIDAIPGGGTGAIPIHSSQPLWKPTDVGRQMRVRMNDDTTTAGWAWGVITSVTDTQNAVIDLKTGVTNTGPTSDWRMGVQTVGQYPCAVCIHGERMVLATNPTDAYPRLDASKSGAFDWFSPGLLADDDAWSATIAADQVPTIRDVKSLRVLVVVTGSGAMRVAGSTGISITPTDIDVAPVPNSTGGAFVPPAVKSKGSVLYFDAQGRTLGEIKAASEIYPDNVEYREISIRAEHIYRESEGASLAYADKPWGQIVSVRRDGAMAFAAYAPAQDVIAFTPGVIGGGGIADSVVLACSKCQTLSGDVPWFLVRRGSLYTVELLSDLLRPADHDSQAVNVDCAVGFRDDRGTSLTRTVGDTWQAGAAVFTATDVGRLIRGNFGQTGKRDAFNQLLWGSRSMRIIAVPAPDTITVQADAGGMPMGPLAAGQWLVSTPSVPVPAMLQGRVVRLLVDGADSGGPIVTDTAAALPPGWEGFVVRVGFGYRSEVQPMPPNPPTQKGSAVGRPILAGKSRLRVWRSAGLKQENWDGSLSAVLPLRQGTQLAGMPPPFYTGDMALDASPESNTPLGPLIVADGAQPFCITHLAPTYAVGELG
jgi:hypothetical protein